MTRLGDALIKAGIFVKPQEDIVKPQEDVVIEQEIDNTHITAHFTWKEALFLPTWNRVANENDGLSQEIKTNLIDIFGILEKIRSLLGNRPISVHCAYRPSKYNSVIGGATRSAHVQGKAVDFSIAGISCDEVRAILVPRLDELMIRMEKLNGSNWIHIDTNKTRPRYFIP